MRNFRLLLIALVFLLHTGAGMAASVRVCCLDAHCPVAECVAMGCIAAPLPPAAVGAAQQGTVAALRAPALPAQRLRIASHVEETYGHRPTDLRPTQRPISRQHNKERL